MAERYEIRSFDYVNRPYGVVREALVADPAAIVEAATGTASRRAASMAADLKVNVAGLEVAAPVALEIGNIVETGEGTPAPVTTIAISWQAAERPRLFPVMDGVLSVYRLTGTETQLDFRGRYEPPLGLLGDAVDAMVGHRLAEASVHRLIKDLAGYLRERLP